MSAAPRAPRSPTYAAIERLVGLGLDLFYRRIHLRGSIPEQGPLLVVANHPNALVDPAVIARMTGRQVRFLGKEPLFRMPLVSWLVRGVGAIPVYRAKDGFDTSKNDETFRAVYAALEAGELICLFPEGIGHNEPKLQPLKTGAARMALGAEAGAGWSLGVKVVPVGLTYRDKPAFRSDLWTEVGLPLVAADYQERFAEDEAAAARAFTDDIAAGLRAVTLNLDRWEDLPLVELAEMVWRSGPSPAAQAERLRLLAEAGARLEREQPAALSALKERLGGLRRALDDAGMGPEHLGQRYTLSVLLWFLLRHGVALTLGLPAVLLGVLAYALPYFALRLVPRLLRSPEDVLATTRILGGLVILPLWHAGLVSSLTYVEPVAVALPLGIALPFCGLYAHAFLKRRKRMFRDAAVFLRLLLSPRLRRELLQERDDIAARIEALARGLAQPAAGGSS